MKGRFIFDVFADKQPVIILPIHLTFRKRGDKRTPTELNKTYLTTISAGSYDEATTQLLDIIREYAGVNK